MIEKTLRKKLREGIMCGMLVGIFVVCLAVLLILRMHESMERIVMRDMRTEASEYKKRILRQIDKEFEILETLAAVCSHGDMTNAEWFSQCLYDANERNDFIVISYFNQDGIGVTVYPGTIRENADYRTFNENIHEAVEKALNGEKSLTRLFVSNKAAKPIFAYAVPVYNEDQSEVVGMMLAGSSIDTFNDIFGEEIDLEKIHAVHLVSTMGRMLISNKFTDLSSIPDSIFTEDSYFTDEEQSDIAKAFDKNTDIFTHMKYMGRDYKVYLTPVGVNNWYIMYVNDDVGVNSVAYKMVYIIGIAVNILLVIIICIMAHTCQLVIKRNRQLVKIAYVDELTGADNVVRFYQKLDSVRSEDGGFALIALNIQHFKFINEIFGIRVADRLLCSISKDIEAFVRDGEFFCRENGDCFYICLKETGEAAIKERIELLMEEICGKKLYHKADYRLTAYAGVLVCGGRSDTVSSNELLMTRVRFALKSAGKMPLERVHFYDAEIHKNEEMKNYVETHMVKALENGEFKLYLQPKIVLETGELGGAEALVRWVTGSGRMIYPDAFIPQFEQNGFCIKLDLYMVEQVCRQIRDWMDAGIEPVPVSVNQSKLLFFDSEYIERLQNILDTYQIPPNMITLEILERLALEHVDEVNEKLRKLRQMGFRISMDDFGSGYSSLNSLGNLEIDELKLDRSLLVEASSANASRFRTIMGHVVSLTKSLDIITVAEGVETLENEKLIKDAGCDFGQGYLYSRPISADEFSVKYMNIH